MSRLGDLENAIVARLAAATISGAPVFATVRGVSGGNRPLLREAIRRERMPVALVAFTEEPTAPELDPERHGAHFAVLVAAQMLRAGANPRQGDATALGAFTLIDKVRVQLDGYAPSGDVELQCLSMKFVDADDRVAIYEILYRAWPEFFSELTFGGDVITGADSRLRIDIGRVAPIEAGEGGAFGRTIVWRGQLRGEDHESLNDIEESIENIIVERRIAEVADDEVRTFADCVLVQFLRIGPRGVDPTDGAIVQKVELLFMQEFGE